MKNLSRRKFLQSAAVAGTGAVFIPSFISCAPSTQLRFAIIGVGGRGGASWERVPAGNLVAMCDVDDNRAAEGYAKRPNAKKYKDFRVMFDEMANEIDAVMISTPDHTHFAAAMTAMELGKHVLVEKPLAHNIWQLRTLQKAAKHYGVVSQMANQGHTTNGIRLIKEWYQAGVLGEVKEVIAWQGKIDFEKDGYFAKPNNFPPEKQEIPAYLDWNLWTGPAAERNFNNIYAPKTWRGFYDFGNGKLGDWACHTLDAPFWALDLKMPHTITGTIPNPVPDHSFVAEESLVEWQFGARGNKAPVTMKWYEGMAKPEIRPEWKIDELPGNGMIMIGDKNTLYTGGRPNAPRLFLPDDEWKDFLKNAPERTFERVGEEKPVEEWINAIKNDSLPGSNFDYSANLTEMAAIGTIAQRFGGRLDYDAKNIKITNRPELADYIKEPVRKGWEYGENLW
jgi:predicted dehydrogenase